MCRYLRCMSLGVDGGLVCSFLKSRMEWRVSKGEGRREDYEPSQSLYISIRH